MLKNLLSANIIAYKTNKKEKNIIIVNLIMILISKVYLYPN